MREQEESSTLAGWIWLGTIFYIVLFYRDMIVNRLLDLFR
jgi:hypothetical protein